MKAIEVFEKYSNALEQGDLESVFSMLSDDVKWNMGGNGPLSGTIIGKKSLADCLGKFAELSKGTFRVITNWAAENGDYVVASVDSLAEKNGKNLKNPGVDLFRIENGKIQEVWTFSQLQAEEDEFWR
ncbi:MAG: nuclear transport factor 2 family protein [Bacillota bacterium]|nr:nuclear transport factor 2 family protein [Bacillota bacterium]